MKSRNKLNAVERKERVGDRDTKAYVGAEAEAQNTGREQRPSKSCERAV